MLIKSSSHDSCLKNKTQLLNSKKKMHIFHKSQVLSSHLSRVWVKVWLSLLSVSVKQVPSPQICESSQIIWPESPHFWCGVVSCLFFLPSSSSCGSRPQQASTGWAFNSEWTIPLRNLAEPIWNSSSPLFFHGAVRLGRYYAEVLLHSFQGGNGAIHLQSRRTEINTGERKRMTKHRRKKKRDV